MLPSLLYRDIKIRTPSTADNRAELCADLGLDALLDAMAGNNQAIKDSVQKILFESPAANETDIIYRQQILKDALDCAEIFRETFNALDAGLNVYEDTRRKSQPGYARFTTVTARLQAAAQLAELVFKLAREIHGHMKKLSASAASAGLKRYAKEFTEFYTDDFIDEALHECAAIGLITEGSRIVLGVKPGRGMKGAGYTIRSIDSIDAGKNAARASNKKRVNIGIETIAMQQKVIELRDAALSKLLNVINTIIIQTADDLKSLMYEMSFYAGCVNLYEKMSAIALPVCFPSLGENAGSAPPLGKNAGAAPSHGGTSEDTLSFNGLSDISLALNHSFTPVTNSLDLNDKRLTIITGANQGGKSTFLRSVGCAQLMAQCGMFVAADSFHFCVRPRIFTHFCKPEDASMDSGKLDEELSRLDNIVDRLAPRSLLLMNESFASTAEREGAALAREVNGAFYDLGVKVLYVTHLFEYARSMEAEGKPDMLFLRAERMEDGKRTFVIKPGLSLPTSYAMDLFREMISS